MKNNKNNIIEVLYIVLAGAMFGIGLRFLFDTVIIFLNTH